MAAGVAAGALMASSAMASNFNLLTNGGFENIGAAAPQGWGGYTYGETYTPVLPGWHIDSGTVDITQNGSPWSPAYQGTNSLDINGWDPGQISQTFKTVAGRTYQVSFAYSRNAAWAPDPALATVSAGGTSVPVSAALGSFGGPGAMTWQTASFNFVAGQGPTSTITLTANNPGNGGVFFDAVKVASVPEPATWATMLAGFGGLGAQLRRSRRRPVAAAATA
jgi:hypothetical protein